MSVTLSGIVTAVSRSQSLKASDSIVFNVAGNKTFFISQN